MRALRIGGNRETVQLRRRLPRSAFRSKGNAMRNRDRVIGFGALVGFVATVFLANWAIKLFGAVPVGFGLEAPAGVYFAGLAFTLRDLVQDRLGRLWVAAAIVASAALSALVTPEFALASGVAFLVSEFLDFAVYTPLRARHWLGAVAASNLVGLVADSALFLSLAFGNLAYLPGQIVGKFWMTVAAVAVLWLLRRRLAPRSPERARVARGGSRV